MKVAYCGYDFFANCLDLLTTMPNVEILKVFTFATDNIYNFNSNIITIAEKSHIPYSLNPVTSTDLHELFEVLNCDCVIVAAYPYKIPIGQYRGINIHPTLLPVGKGPWPLPGVILSGQKESGVTIHKLADKMDSGDILIQGRFEILPREDLETLSCRSQMLAKKLIAELFSDFQSYWDAAVAQDEGEYWHYPTDEEMTFSGEMTVDEIDRIVRAYGKFDSCVKFGGRSWLVWDVNCWKEQHNYSPGDIVHQTSREYVMAAKDGFVCMRFLCEEKHNEDENT